jgi:signal recognition particle subunit SRP54
MGEATDKFEAFRPDGMAGRVLGMGDVVGLMKDFQEVVDEKKVAEDAMRMMEGNFTLDDFLDQIRMIQRMGSLKDLVGKMPGMGDMVEQMGAAPNLDDRELVRIEAMIQSFTKQERADCYTLIREPNRVKRIAKGSGQPEQGVNELVQKFLFMKQMMGGLGQNLGFMGKIPGLNKVAMMKNLQKMAKGGGMPGMGGMGGMPDLASMMGGMPGMGGMGGMPGMGGMMGGFPGMMGGMPQDSMTKMKSMSVAEKNAKKAARKREKDARKKGRR